MNSRVVLRSIAASSVAGWLLGACQFASAAILTAVPMQGGMVMPMISYLASDGMMHVMVPTDKPVLTPLLVSNPSDTFDPADPWYNSLDPRRQGLAFSRRFGFVMDASSDPLPANTAIWIRKLSGLPALEAYRYNSSTPKMWLPIFGTAGSSNALYWSGMMFHPCFAAPPGTNSWTATFEAYLVSTNTMTELTATSTGPFVLNWTDIPDGRPTLGAGINCTITWPITATNYLLEAADTLTATNWVTVTNTPVVLDGRSAIISDQTQPIKFYRMRYSP